MKPVIPAQAGIFLLFSIFSLNSCAFLLRDHSYPPPDPSSTERMYRGVFHVHSQYSHDSKATLEQIAETAVHAGLDFVVVTDHNNRAGASVYPSLQVRRPPYLIFGEEISAPDGHLIMIGVEASTPKNKSSEELIEWIHQQGGFTILAHPASEKNPWDRPEMSGIDGLEVYSFAHSFYESNKWTLIPKMALLPPKTFLRFHQEISEKAFHLWDKKLTKGERVFAVGGADAHMHVKIAGWGPESYLLQFSSVTQYVPGDALFDEEAIVEALGAGRSFVAFDVHGYATKFKFYAKKGEERFEMGDSVQGQATLYVESPQSGQIKLIHNGVITREHYGKTFSYFAEKPGAYRIEIHQGKKLWIISNPIYLI